MTKIITKLYKNLQNQKLENTQYIKNKWEMEGNLNILEEDWESILKSQWKTPQLGENLVGKISLDFSSPLSRRDTKARMQPAGDCAAQIKPTIAIYSGNALKFRNIGNP